MNEETLLTQMGLLLTQTRFARRALEDIERSTSQYATFTFTSVIAAGPRFGEPPLFDGALKVHVVNLSDLAPGGGFGDFLEGLLGGVGRLIGNIPGGLIGGTLGSLSIISALPTIHDIAVRVENILGLLNLRGGDRIEDATAGARGQPVGGSTLTTQLGAITKAIEALAGLFFVAAGRPEQAAQTSVLPGTVEGGAWLRLLDSATATLTALSRLVDGLILALPEVIGSISWLLARLPDIRLAVAETLKFLLRQALLLRGLVFVTMFDTFAMVARTAAGVLAILQSTVDAMLSAIFDTVREALLAVFDLAGVLGAAISATVDALLNWLVPAVDTILRNLGDLRVFRVITHVVRILPAILPIIYEIVADQPLAGTADRPGALNPEQIERLNEAARLPFLDPLHRGGVAPVAVTPPSAPNFQAILTDPKTIGHATVALDRIQQVTRNGLQITGDAVTGGLRDVAGKLDRAAAAEAKLSDSTLDKHLGQVRERSTELAQNLIVGEKVRTDTGLEAIAQAYESWLTRGGLDTLLGKITEHFAGPEARKGVPAAAAAVMDRPRATVQIDEVLIDLSGTPGPALREIPPPAAEPERPLGPGDFPLPPDRDDAERHARMWFELGERNGGRGVLPSPA
ncbi:hypothetical protein AB0H76_17920 [Nocardia sp. NPDC050712]|uniref:hypothetical protein n=1 Tax=Nocardia sp. NPDC050712 TaxID=3155518 RepID=UPI0033CCE4F5